MLLIISIGFVLTFFTTVSASTERYDGYNKYTIFHKDEDAFKFMVGLQTNDNILDFWLLTRNMSIVSVGPIIQPYFEDQMNAIGAAYVVTSLTEEMANFNETEGDRCDENNSDSMCSLRRSTRQTGGFFRRYPSHAEILQYMQGLAARYPKYAKFEVFGRSHEGRIIGGLSISLNRRRDKKLAYIQGGVHGREWISPISVLFFGAELLNNILAFRSVLADVEVYIVPLLNPDGYEYTQLRDRFWRKNRHRYSGRSCVGVDINRNFGHFWNLRGASRNHCSEVFSGLGPTSEFETQSVKRFLNYNRGRTKLVLDVHSFGQFIFYPYGYTKTPIPTRSLLHAIANRAALQIAKYRGTVYTAGTSSSILYEASGGLDDYAYDVFGIPMSYTLELPGDNFQVATSDIIHVCKETFAGYVEFIRHIGLF